MLCKISCYIRTSCGERKYPRLLRSIERVLSLRFPTYCHLGSWNSQAILCKISCYIRKSGDERKGELSLEPCHQYRFGRAPPNMRCRLTLNVEKKKVLKLGIQKCVLWPVKPNDIQRKKAIFWFRRPWMVKFWASAIHTPYALLRIILGCGGMSELVLTSCILEI